MYDWLREAVDTTAVIVTASRRLSRELQHAYDRSQVAAGNSAWRTPEIVVLSTWVGSTLDDIADDTHALRISPSISAALWYQVARKHLPDDLPGVSGILQQCRTARDRLAAWQVPVETVRARSFGIEHRQFARALTDYRQILQERNWIDDSGLIPVLLRELETGRASAPERIVFAGFDRLSPVLQALVDRLQAAGCVVQVQAAGDECGPAIAGRYADIDAEMRAAGAWAREELAKNPQCRIAILRSDLDADADNMARRLREGFAPGWQLGGHGHHSAVGVSYGRRLSEYPAIASALLILRWLRGALASSEVGSLLCSAHFAAGTAGLRASLDQSLRDLPERPWRPANLVKTLGDAEGPGAEWGAAMQPLIDASTQPDEKLLPSQWAERFDELLAALGWPGKEKLSSQDFQLVNRWRELLNEFATLDLVEGEVPAAAAVSRLVQLASEAVYQPQGREGSLPLMGVLEAAGFEFDKIWLCGFDSARWPLPGRPLSLLPRQLQREFAMPDASEADSLQFSRRVLRRLAGSAQEVRLSFAESEDGVPLELSQLASEFAALTDCDALDPGWFAAAQVGAEIDALAAEIPPVAAGDKVYGGAYTVQRQHTDPFAGFAGGRLGARALSAYQRGFSALARGRLVHDALHRLYEELPGRADIANWNDDDVSQRVRQSVSDALKRYRFQADDSMLGFVAIENDRLRRILTDLIAKDVLRDEFQIQQLEEASTLRHQNVEIRLRIDRVDQMQDGTSLIIDYKTGSEKKLYSSREKQLNDLQLAVYALAIDGEPGGLAIYNVNSKDVKLASSSDLDNFGELLQGWTAEALRALDGLATGDARINTKIARSDARPLSILSRYEQVRDD